MTSVHLLVLIHGMWGHPGHLSEMARIIRETRNADDDDIELKVLLAEANRHDGTYDGIDWGGERVAQEIIDEIGELRREGTTVTKFSVIGYSLGGLVARYLVGTLNQRGFFESVTPVNFCTIATPHLGIPKTRQLRSTIFAFIGPRFLSRTGKQFYSVDKWSTTGRPLLEVMADPQWIFYQTLLKFPHLKIYANAINDTTVPYLTAAIETEDPFMYRATNGLEIVIDDRYGPLIKTYTVPDEPPLPVANPIMLSPKWFRSLKSDRPFLPPAFQYKFPFNILIYVLLPILLPPLMSLALFRLSWASYHSNARIKLLEKDETHRNSLVYAITDLEKKVEDVVAALIDDPRPDSTLDTPEGANGRAGTPIEILGSGSDSQTPLVSQVLTPLQVRMAASLNTLPHLKKERVYIEHVLNAHAPIVCRDVKRFTTHRIGEGVLRHLADNLVL